MSQPGDDIRSDTRDMSSRTIMSTRSTERPSRQNRQVSSRLIVESAMPENIAARSST